VAAGELEGAQLTVAEAVALALPDKDRAVATESLLHW